jgi:hypothetical protein
VYSSRRQPPHWLGLLAVALLVAGCADRRAAAPGPVAPPGPAASSAGPGSPWSGCPDETEWSCAQQQRFAAVRSYLARTVRTNGFLGVVFTDRQTGHTWRGGATQRQGWTASTVKLAIAADLLAEQRAGHLRLTDADRRDMDAMLNSSDEAASDRLWKKFGGDDMLARFRERFGMASLRFVPGFTARTYWGFVKCDTDDLAVLVDHVLVRTAPSDRDYLVNALRTVAPNQHWGVWAAGAAQQPGNKDGWSDEADPYGRHWVTNTVGFAGPAQRYEVAVMYQVDPAGSLSEGVHAVSDVVALLFDQPVPAEVTLPLPDG